MGIWSSVLVEDVVGTLRFDYLWLSRRFHPITSSPRTNLFQQILPMQILFLIIIGNILNRIRQIREIVVLLIVLDC